MQGQIPFKGSTISFSAGIPIQWWARSFPQLQFIPFDAHVHHSWLSSVISSKGSRTLIHNGSAHQAVVPGNFITDNNSVVYQRPAL